MSTLLYMIRKEINKIRSITTPKFYTFIVPNEDSILRVEDSRTMAKYIRDTPPKKVIEFYKDRTNEGVIKNHLRSWCDYLGENHDIIANAILNIFNENSQEAISNRLKAIMHSKTDFYYEVFRYCITGKSVISTPPSLADRLLEFNDTILTQYGVSGRTGKVVILQKAKAGSTNPYILFEAAEIEYMKRYDKDKTNDKCLENAYNYYKKASDLGFPLADWSLGFLAQMSNKKVWNISAFENLDQDKKMELAVYYYKKAASQNCSKAFNSLGNIVEKVNDNLKKELKTAKEYYFIAAEMNNLFAMYNYAKVLEKEIKNELLDYKSNKEANLSRLKKTATTIVNYYYKAAELGYGFACYRYALIKGHLIDEKSLTLEQYAILDIKKDINTSIRYLEKAIVLSPDDAPCYDAYIFLCQYIINNKNLFFKWDDELGKAEKYIRFLESKLRSGDKFYSRQRNMILELGKIIHNEYKAVFFDMVEDTVN